MKIIIDDKYISCNESCENCAKDKCIQTNTKSIDGLIEKIQESKIDVDLDIGQEMHYNNAVDDIIEIIKEYCGGKNDNTNKAYKHTHR